MWITALSHSLIEVDNLVCMTAHDEFEIFFAIFWSRCCVVGFDGSKLDLSLRRSRTGEPPDDVIMKSDTEGEREEDEGDERGKGVAEEGPCDPEIASLEDLEVGKVVRGFVKAVTDVGVFVR